MNKTGPQLLELSPGEGFSIQEKYVAADTLYSQIKEDVKKRAVALDEAISQSTQVIIGARKMIELFGTEERGNTFSWISWLNFQRNYFTTLNLSMDVLASQKWYLVGRVLTFLCLLGDQYKIIVSDLRNIQLSSLSKYWSGSRVERNICLWER